MSSIDDYLGRARTASMGSKYKLEGRSQTKDPLNALAAPSKLNLTKPHLMHLSNMRITVQVTLILKSQQKCLLGRTMKHFQHKFKLNAVAVK